MADKAISELIAAQKVNPGDLFVLEQDGTAKKLTGQVLENWLLAMADGHGGISGISKVSTSGLVDTYRITMSDQTTFDYKITNGAKGDKGDNAYMWIKYASQKPTPDSHSMGDVPDDWIGIYSGTVGIAPSDWTLYRWFKYKGEKGDIGNPATVTSSKVEYQVGSSGTVVPSGQWSTNIPTVSQGSYLWTRTTVQFNSGAAIISYSVGRFGLDGLGSVVSVCDQSPDGNGNVNLSAENVGALPTEGGSMEGPLDMNGQKLDGLNDPVANDEAASKGYVDRTCAEKESKRLEFHNTTIPKTAFLANDAYKQDGYPYRAAVPLTGVLTSMTPQVVFSVADVVGGNFAPVAECYAGGVYIYAASVPEGNITIPTIICWKAVS